MTMLQQFLESARADKPVYISRVRDAFQDPAESVALRPFPALRRADGRQGMGLVLEHQELQGLVPGAAADHLPVVPGLLQERVDAGVRGDALARGVAADAYLPTS